MLTEVFEEKEFTRGDLLMNKKLFVKSSTSKV